MSLLHVVALARHCGFRALQIRARQEKAIRGYLVAGSQVKQVTNHDVVHGYLDGLVAVVAEGENLAVVGHGRKRAKLPLFGIVVSGRDKNDNDDGDDDGKAFDPTGCCAFQHAAQYNGHDGSDAENAQGGVFKCVKAQFPECGLGREPLSDE